MTQPRDDRILPLSCLSAYPGSASLDAAFFLPGEAYGTTGPRRVWLMAPAGSPAVHIDDVALTPQRVCPGPPRWIDYGQADLPARFSQLRVSGLSPAECAEAWLLVTKRLDFSAEGLSMAEAERALWGLARCNAGVTTLRPSRLAAGRPAAFAVRYTAGAAGLPPGARVRFAVPLAFDTPQADDPAAAGFVSFGPADRPVEVAEIYRPAESHEAWDIVCRLPDGLGAGEGFELRYRSERMWIFTGVFHGTDRRYWYVHLPPLSAAAAVGPDAPFVSPDEANGHTFELLPGPAERLVLFLPGRRCRGEALTLRGVFTDRYRNVPPSGPIDGDVELFLEGPGGPIALDGPAGRFRARHRFEVPLGDLPCGVWRAVARRAGRTVARSNPLEIVEADRKTERVYWGEIHGHSEMSDGCGKYAERYRHARDEGALDFAAAADHACYHSDNQWQWMQDVTNAFNAPGAFATLIGYEWAGRQGHRNVYTDRDRLDLFRGMYPPTGDLDVVWRHFHDDAHVVGGPHAPCAHGVVWQRHDPAVERFVEIYSMWGASDDRNNPLAPWRIKDGDVRGTMTAAEIIATGAKLGFTGGGDCHEGLVGFTCEDPDGQGVTPHTFAPHLAYRCGMTAAVMEALDRPSLLAALRHRRTYATTGARILLDFSASGVAMGGIDQARAATCRTEVHAVGSIDRVEFVKDGRVAYAAPGGGLDAAVEWTDPAALEREHFYYVRIVQADGEMAWSSPVWLAPPTGR